MRVVNVSPDNKGRKNSKAQKEFEEKRKAM